MAGSENMDENRSKEILEEFLKTYSIEYIGRESLVEFEKGFRYIISFEKNSILLCDNRMNVLQKENVFEIMHYLIGVLSASS